MKNYYSILGVESNSSQVEIKSAYRNLALKHHPDRVVAEQKNYAHQKFVEIGEAYEILSDIEKRKEYNILYEKYFENKTRYTATEYAKYEDHFKGTQQKAHENAARFADEAFNRIADATYNVAEKVAGRKYAGCLIWLIFPIAFFVLFGFFENHTVGILGSLAGLIALFILGHFGDKLEAIVKNKEKS